MKVRPVTVIAVWVAIAITAGVVAGVRSRNEARHRSPCVIELQKLRSLYANRRSVELANECDMARVDPRYSTCVPEILFFGWAANWRLGKIEAADQIQRELVERFPDHPNTGEVRLVGAERLLAAGEYDEADRDLAAIAEKWPSAAFATKAKGLRARLPVRPATMPIAP